MSVIRGIFDNAGLAERAQVDTITLGGTWESDDEATITLASENNALTQSITVVSGSTTKSAIATTIATALTNAADPTHSTHKGLFKDITFQASGDTVICTATVAGVPFYLSVSTTETGGGTADSQTISRGATTTCLSKRDANNPKNYSGEALPTNSDVLVLDGACQNEIKFGLSQLSAVTLARMDIYDSFVHRIGMWQKIAGLTVTGFALKIGCTLCNIGLPNGDQQRRGGSRLLMIDFGTVQATVNVFGSPDSGAIPGLPPIMLVGTHASNRFAMQGSANVGWGVMTPGSSYTLTHAENRARGKLTLDTGGTVTNVLTDHEQAQTVLRCAASGNDPASNYGVILNAGCLTVEGTGTVTRLLTNGGRLKLNNARGGTAITTALFLAGQIDSTGDPRTFTIGTVQVFDATRASFTAVPNQVTVSTGSIPFNQKGVAGANAGGGAYTQ